MDNPRFIITVDRALLDSDPSNPSVIRVENTRTGEVTHSAGVKLLTPIHDDLDGFHPNDDRAPVIRYGPQRQDGARVWIECDGWEPVDEG